MTQTLVRTAGPTNIWIIEGDPTDKSAFSGLVFSAKVFSTLIKAYPAWTAEPPQPHSIWTVEP